MAHHYLNTYKPEQLLKLSKQGLFAYSGMTPVYPSKTFPNHITMVTGKYPNEHGIVHNSFYHRDIKEVYSLGAGKDNSNWLKAEPIWITAEKQGVKAATYFWPESEAKYDGKHPSYWFPYHHNTPNKDRLAQVLKWLQMPEQKRPQFISTYFSTVDSAGHDFGINSEEVKQAIAEIDSLFPWFYQELDRLNIDINLVLVSDHGMTDISEQTITLESLPIDKNIDRAVNGQTQIYLYEDDKALLNKTVKALKQVADGRFDVFKFGDYPEHWRMNNSNAYVPDAVVSLLPPYTIQGKYHGKATHGFDAKGKQELAAIFIATGPDIKLGSIAPFENVYVHDLLIKLLDLDKQSNRADIFEQHIK